MCIKDDICGEDRNPLGWLIIFQIFGLAYQVFDNMSIPQDLYYIMSYTQVTGLDLRLTDI